MVLIWSSPNVISHILFPIFINENALEEKNTIPEFCQQTSLHGWHIHHVNTNGGYAVWLGIVLASLAMASIFFNYIYSHSTFCHKICSHNHRNYLSTTFLCNFFEKSWYWWLNLDPARISPSKEDGFFIFSSWNLCRAPVCHL